MQKKQPATYGSEGMMWITRGSTLKKPHSSKGFGQPGPGPRRGNTPGEIMQGRPADVHENDFKDFSLGETTQDEYLHQLQVNDHENDITC